MRRREFSEVVNVLYVFTIYIWSVTLTARDLSTNKTIYCNFIKGQAAYLKQDKRDILGSARTRKVI